MIPRQNMARTGFKTANVQEKIVTRYTKNGGGFNPNTDTNGITW